MLCGQQPYWNRLHGIAELLSNVCDHSSCEEGLQNVHKQLQPGGGGGRRDRQTDRETDLLVPENGLSQQVFRRRSTIVMNGCRHHHHICLIQSSTLSYASKAGKVAIQRRFTPGAQKTRRSNKGRKQGNISKGCESEWSLRN